MQICLENEANHRALRRCYSCGAYARPFELDESNGAIRCRPCAEKAQRRRQELSDDRDREDPTEVSFLI